MHQRQDHHQDDRARAQHQRRLDDLHPGRRQHTAESNVDDHADADENHCPVVGNSGQQSHQHAGTSHLRHQIGEVDNHRSHNGREQGGSRLHPAADDIAQSIFSGIAHRLRDHKQYRAKGDERAKRVERAIHAVKRGEPGKPQEGSGAAPVAGQRKSILRRGKLAVGGVEIARGTRAPCGPIGDAKRDQQDDDEYAEREAHLNFPARRSPSRPSRQADRTCRRRWLRRPSRLPMTADS